MRIIPNGHRPAYPKNMGYQAVLKSFGGLVKYPLVGSHFAIFVSLFLGVIFTSAGETVRTASALRQAKTDGKLGTDFDLQAVVTYNARTRGEHLTLQDESAAISAWYHADLDPNAISPGDLVRATGRINRGQRSGLVIDCTGIEILKHGHLPAPLSVTAEDLSQNDFGNRLVRLEGTVVDAVPDDLDAEWAYVVLKCGRMNAYVATRTHGLRLQPEKFIGARVSATGVRHGGGGQRRMIDATLYLDSLDSLTMLERTPSEDPFLAPDVGNLCFFGRNACPAGERRSATGTVLAVWNSNNVLLRTDSGSLVKGELIQTTPPRCGDRIRLVGFPETDLYTVILVRADWRTEPGTALSDEETTNITPLQLQTPYPGGTRFEFAYQGRPVSLRGHVRGLPVSRADNRLYLECDGQMVTVDVCACPEALADLTTDCTVEIRGTCVMETERMSQNLAFPRIRGFLIALRTLDDVRVLARPPWWTPTRLLVAICGLLLALAAIFVWNVLLRRLAERRGRELMGEQLARVESDLKVSERTRLSVELHDTLSQNLIGASMEINTAEQLVSDAEALRHLGIASKTLKSSRDELRNCLWDLRSEALEEADMNEAIRKTLAPYIEDIDLQVRFNVPRSLFTDNTAHTLMRIIRELVLNAIRHGHAKSVRIAGSREDGRLFFSVKDDGCGFDPNAAPGIAQGHFGLQGVRERLRHLKGRLEISSSSAQGTKVTASMELPKTDGIRL